MPELDVARLAEQMRTRIVCFLVTCIYLAIIPSANLAFAANLRLVPTDETTDPGFVEIVGVDAGKFNPALWQSGNLNLLPDVRSPLLEPQPGKFRNIYAPSVVETRRGWRVFYGAWDGVPTGNDRIYSVTTPDFLSFNDRQTVIEHGPFTHVCNVSAVTTSGRGIALMCTAYPDVGKLNKPAFFSSRDGQNWNGSPAPYTATSNDIIRIHGYENYAVADINGMNVILLENGQYRLYFANLRSLTEVYRASGKNGKDFQFEGVALPQGLAVNDVKKFRVGSTNWYLMGLHRNRSQTWFSLSTDGMNFAPAQPLFTNATPAEQYIVAVGWVVSGAQEKQGRRLLGVLYGAGAVKSLDKNRIFARWLQPRIVLRDANGVETVGNSARGPNRQLIPVRDETWTGDVQLFDEGGRELFAEIKKARLTTGKVYRLRGNGPVILDEQISFRQRDQRRQFLSPRVPPS